MVTKQLICTVKSIKMCPPKITCRQTGEGGARVLRALGRSTTAHHMYIKLCQITNKILRQVCL